MCKYFKVIIFNLKSELNFKADFIASLFSFTIHVLVFNFLWDFILGNKLTFNYTKNQLIWYVIIGELITYTSSRSYKKISDMIKTGQVSIMLIKPINFLGYIICEESIAIVKFIFNFIFAIILGVLLAGNIRLNFINIIYFSLSMFFSTFLLTSLQVVIGISAFIIEENRAIYNIVIKFILLLLFTPLEFFSNKIKILLKMLPTTYVVYPTSKIFVKFNFIEDIYLILGQLISIIIIWLLIIILYKKGVKNINVNGG